MIKIKIISIVIIIFLLCPFTLNVSSNKDYINKELSENIKLLFSFKKPSIEIFNKDNEIIHRVKIDGLENTVDYNKPILPVKNLRILIVQDY